MFKSRPKTWHFIRKWLIYKPNVILDQIQTQTNGQTQIKNKNKVPWSGLFSVPRITTKHGKAALSYYAPTIWNKQPKSCTFAETIPILKSRLKTHLFAAAFNWAAHTHIQYAFSVMYSVPAVYNYLFYFITFAYNAFLIMYLILYLFLNVFCF